MKKFLIAVIALSCAFAFTYSPAHAEPLKIGVFDLQVIMAKSKVIQGYRQNIGKEAEADRKVLTDKQESARQTEERLKKEGQKLSVGERKLLEEKLANGVRELKRLKEDMEAALQKKDRELTQQVLGEIEKIIKGIADKEDYTIVFERSAAGVVYFKDWVDITEKIIREYDKG